VRILAAIILVTALGLAAAGAITLLVQRQLAMEAIDERLLADVASARSIATPDAGTPYATNAEALRAILGRVIPGYGEGSVGIVDGVATYVPGVAADVSLADDSAFVRRVSGEVDDGSVRIGTYLSADGQLRYLASPVAVVDGSEPAIYVTAIDLETEDSELASAILTFVAAAIIVLAAVALVGWMVAGRLLEPISTLTAAAAEISASNRRARIPVSGNDDVSRLTENINGMLDRLDAALTGQRQLLEDVRHELRTPITIVRGHLELLQSGRETDLQRVAAVSIGELDRMTQLIEELESLAEAQATTLQPTEVDVAELTADVLTAASGIAGHRWLAGGTAASTVSMDRSRIMQAWLQLVANAAKFSPEGSAIEIGSSDLQDAVELWVSDSGPGVPEPARERIFERFGRVETGRGESGSGLGLAIVAALVNAHGGRVALDSDEHGSRFALVIPRSPRQTKEGG
jgi:signal transduction histidine kinase